MRVGVVLSHRMKINLLALVSKYNNQVKSMEYFTLKKGGLHIRRGWGTTDTPISPFIYGDREV